MSEDLLNEAMDDSTRLLKEAYELSEEKIRAIISAIPDMIFVLTREGDYEEFYSSESNIPNLLTPREFFIGKNVKDILPGDLAVRFLAEFDKALSGENLEIEVELHIEHLARVQNSHVNHSVFGRYT